MFNTAVAQQIKQNILNYQIQMIQQCPESLFTQGNCQHHRYLGWELGDSLQRILQNYSYTFRWMGNDHNAHVYAYFYIAIIGCSSNKSTMVQLKTVMYGLSKKYLAQYQQKFLIQFLCLIEYSQDKFHFFRKYQKMEGILLKIFKQIQLRHPLNVTQSFRPCSEQENLASQITTGINSPSKSRLADYQKSKILRNSDYYNSSMKKIEQQYRADLALRLKKDSNYNTAHFVSWYQTYNKIFSFMKMMILSEQNVKFEIEIDKKSKIAAQFIVTLEKGCFFVVQMFKADKSKTSSRKDASELSRPCSAIQESQQYLNTLLQREIKQSQVKKDTLDFSKPRNKKERLSFTPKFISNKKKLSWNNSNDLYSGEVNDKNVQIEVLDLSEFKQNTQKNQPSYKNMTSQQSNCQSYKEIDSKTINYPHKITGLKSIGQSVKSVEKNSIIQEIKSYTGFDLYKNNIKSTRKFQDSTYHRAPRYNPDNQQSLIQFTSQKSITKTYGYQNNLSNRMEGKKVDTFNGGFPYNKTLNNKQTSLCSISQNASTIRLPYDGKVILPKNISEVPANQTFLSAKNLKKRQNLVFDFRKNNILEYHKVGKTQNRQFHSHSPPQPIIDLKKNFLKFKPFYSPSRPSGRIGDESINEYGPKIKFTYH